jgi:hypothetical protein
MPTSSTDNGNGQVSGLNQGCYSSSQLDCCRGRFGESEEKPLVNPITGLGSMTVWIADCGCAARQQCGAFWVWFTTFTLLSLWRRE